MKIENSGSLIENEQNLLAFVQSQLESRGSKVNVPASLKELSEEALSAVQTADMYFLYGMTEKKLALEIIVHKIEVDGLTKGLLDNNALRDALLYEDLKLQEMLYAKSRGKLDDDVIFAKYQELEAKTLEAININLSEGRRV